MAAIARITFAKAKAIIPASPFLLKCLHPRRRVNRSLRQIHNEENYNIPKVPLPVLSIFVFRLAGASFVYVPVAIVMFACATSLKGGDCNPISSFVCL